jgi:hypothetical protein
MVTAGGKATAAHVLLPNKYVLELGVPVAESCAVPTAPLFRLSLSILLSAIIVFLLQI